jgi:hypothetical protein
MKSSHNILNIENENYNYYLDSDHCGCINRTSIMNSLHKISYGLFALTLVAIYFSNMNATFAFFTCAVLVLAFATYINDMKDK